MPFYSTLGFLIFLEIGTSTGRIYLPRAVFVHPQLTRAHTGEEGSTRRTLREPCGLVREPPHGIEFRSVVILPIFRLPDQRLLFKG